SARRLPEGPSLAVLPLAAADRLEPHDRRPPLPSASRPAERRPRGAGRAAGRVGPGAGRTAPGRRGPQYRVAARRAAGAGAPRPGTAAGARPRGAGLAVPGTAFARRGGRGAGRQRGRGARPDAAGLTPAARHPQDPGRPAVKTQTNPTLANRSAELAL